MGRERLLMKYISLGYCCSIATDLEKLGLRDQSSPFDWLISDLKGVIMAIREHFSDFLSYEYLSQDMNNHAIYKNTKYNVSFFHDFDQYRPLKKQLPDVQAKYYRRIERFYDSIKEPVLFIRYISDEQKVGGVSEELLWIEAHYEEILALLKSFHADNDILFIANEGVTSQKIKIYNVSRDENDIVARSPICKNPVLYERFSSIDFPDKQANIDRSKRQRGKLRKIKKKGRAFLKKTFLKEYVHDVQH